MSGVRWRLFRLLGIPINADPTWLVILALLTWTLILLFQQAAPDLSPAAHWLLGAATALGFFACIVLHELGHAVVARAVGIRVRGITLFLFGGVAELEEEPASARAEFLMAIAGPAVSAALAALFWFLAGLVPLQALAFALDYLTVINLAVLVFNLVPAFPLDGGRVLRSLLWVAMRNLRRATYWAALCGVGFSWLLIGTGLVFLFSGPGYLFQGIWLGLIGLFLQNAARASYQQVLIRQALQGEPVSRFMSRKPIVVPPDLDLRHWVEDYVYRHHRKLFPVASDGHVEGVISTAMLGRYPRDEWDRHTVAEAMRRDVETFSIPPNADALQALERMQHTDSSRLLVTEGGRLVGIITLKDLLAFLNLKIELEEGSGPGRNGSAGQGHPPVAPLPR
jgi:Zn-dependent protease/CBS domain-containing protein